MKTLQEKYNAVLEGNFPKSQFVRDAKMEVPRFISPYNGFEDTVQILKNKGMLVEAKAETPEYDKPAPGYPLEALERGVDYELEKMGLMSNETVSEEDYAKAKKKAEKNLEKDVNHYLHLLSGDSKKVDKHDREVEVDQKKLFKGTVDPKGGKAEGNTDTYNAMKKATLREAAMAKGYTKDQVEAAIKRLQEKKENKVDEAAKETSFSSDEIKSVSFPNGLKLTVGEEHPEEEGTVTEIEKGQNGYYITLTTFGYAVDFNGEFLDEEDFIEENKAVKEQMYIDDDEFESEMVQDRVKEILPIINKSQYFDGEVPEEIAIEFVKMHRQDIRGASDDEIAMEFDNFIDANPELIGNVKIKGLRAADDEGLREGAIKEAVKKVIKHVLKENHQSLDLEVARRIEGLLDQKLKAKFLEAGKDLIEDLVKEDQFVKNDVVSHLANELNLHVPIRDLFKEGTLNERVGGLQDFINLIQDRAVDSEFSEEEEALEVIEAIADHYGIKIQTGGFVGEGKTIDVYGDGDVVVNIDKATPEQERLLDFEFEISEFEDSAEAQEVADQIMNLNSVYDVEDYYANERGWDEDSDLRSMVRTAIDAFRGLNENQDAIKFAQFIHAHGLKDKQIKDEEYLKDLYDNYKENVKENTNEK